MEPRKSFGLLVRGTFGVDSARDYVLFIAFMPLKNNLLPGEIEKFAYRRLAARDGRIAFKRLENLAPQHIIQLGRRRGGAGYNASGKTEEKPYYS